ncbi:MAG: hypothetical protein ACYTFI_17250 [Planctomycetota bacterium]
MAQDVAERDASRARESTPTAGGGAFDPPESDLSPQDRDELIDSIARRVIARGLSTPATFFLEMHKPLCFFGSQLLLLGSPILGPFVGFGRLARFSSLIEKRENVELLLRRIEELSAGGSEESPAREAGGSGPEDADEASSPGDPERERGQ